MGTCTWVAAPDAFSPNDSSVGYQVYGTLTMSNSYTAGTGDVFNGTMIGVGAIQFLDLGSGNGISTGPNPPAGAYFGIAYLDASGNVQGIRVYQSPAAAGPFTEITNGTNLVNLSFQACAQKTT